MEDGLEYVTSTGTTKMHMSPAMSLDTPQLVCTCHCKGLWELL